MLMFEKMCMSSCAMSCWIDVMRSCQIVYWTFIWAYHTLMAFKLDCLGSQWPYQDVSLGYVHIELIIIMTRNGQDMAWRQHGKQG